MSFSGYFSVKPAVNFVEGVGVLKRKARKFQAELVLRQKKFGEETISVGKVLQGFK